MAVVAYCGIRIVGRAAPGADGSAGAVFLLADGVRNFRLSRVPGALEDIIDTILGMVGSRTRLACCHERRLKRLEPDGSDLLTRHAHLVTPAMSRDTFGTWRRAPNGRHPVPLREGLVHDSHGQHALLVVIQSLDSLGIIRRIAVQESFALRLLRGGLTGIVQLPLLKLLHKLLVVRTSNPLIDTWVSRIHTGRENLPGHLVAARPDQQSLVSGLILINTKIVEVRNTQLLWRGDGKSSAAIRGEQSSQRSNEKCPVHAGEEVLL